MTISPEQSRAARALLNWGQEKLAEASNVSRMTINFFESGKRKPGANNLAAIRAALEAAGVEFMDGGVRIPTEGEQ